MKTDAASAQSLIRILLYVLAYLLWLVNMLVCIAALIQLRSAVNVLWVALGGNSYSLGLVNQLIWLLGGLAGFVYVVFLEAYYRGAVARAASPHAGNTGSAPEPASRDGRLVRWLTRAGLPVLLRRFAITTAIPLGVFVLSLVLLEVALRVLPA